MPEVTEHAGEGPSLPGRDPKKTLETEILAVHEESKNLPETISARAENSR